MYGKMVALAFKACAALSVLSFASCAKTGIIEDGEVDTVGIYSMSFTNAGVVQQSSTKASSSLTSGFIETTWKKYGAGNVPVMENYIVEYKTSGTAWDGTVRAYWDYTGVSGQYEKFWDLSGFPYRFHAISPYPDNLSGFAFGSSLKIPASYKSQTFTDGVVSPSAPEPYLVAQAQRAEDGKDYDVFAGNAEIDSNGNVSKTRSVALPFHHLNTKVRFGVYSTSPWVSANHLYIKNLTVQTSSSDFVTAASGYESNGSWQILTGNSGFYGLTKSTASVTLMQLTGGVDDKYDLMDRQTQKTAYWLDCESGLAQIPQENVKMTVNLTLVDGSGNEKKTFTNVPVKLADNTQVFNWKSGFINTYYLIINYDDEKLELEFTATLTPWEDVTGSLSTDLEK